MLGATASDCRAHRKLGEGGMNEVYNALNLRLQRHYALAALLPYVGAVCGTGDGRLFPVMTCYEGETLDARPSRRSGNRSQSEDLEHRRE